MAVMAPRESWTDNRLDDFRQNVNQRFDFVDQRFDFVDQRFDAVDKSLSRLDADIRELRRMMFQGFLVLVGVMVTGFLSLAGLTVF